MLLALLIVAGSVAVPALQPDRFEKAVLNTVKPEAVGMSESDLAAFALETMAYLRGEKADWQPVTPFAIPQSFVVHMAEVRGWVDVLKWALPAGVMIECYATTLHYAPCHADPAKGFRVLIGLPLNTNTDYRPAGGANQKDATLWARNKWLLAHPESSEAAEGAFVGLYGENIDIAADL